ncbi:MAG: aldehyde dehydrogenase EutE, partial [Planctomycetaceae bacterium]
MQATEQTIRQVVQEVLTQLNGQPNGGQPSGNWGVFSSVDDAVRAAQQGFEQLSRAPMAKRRTA